MRISDWSSDVCSSHLSISPKNVATSRRQARKRLLREVKIPAGIVSALGLTQIIGYGTLYYSFPILSPAIAADLGLSLEWRPEERSVGKECVSTFTSRGSAST